MSYIAHKSSEMRGDSRADPRPMEKIHLEMFGDGNRISQQLIFSVNRYFLFHQVALSIKCF